MFNNQPDYPLPINSSAAMEIQYENIKHNLVYKGKRYIPLPKGERIGHDNLLIMLSPSQEDTVRELQTDYIRWYLNAYKWYTIDTIFREKIGKKRIMRNLTAVTRRDWSKTKFPHPLRYMSYQQRASQLRNTPNLIVDLGEWTKLYFEYSYKVSVPVIIKNYIKFLASKLTDPVYSGYTNRILYVPINEWFGDAKVSLGFTRSMLNNPLAILLFAAYRYPDLLSAIPNMTIILGDSTNDQFLVYNTSDFNRSNFNKMKMRMRTMAGFRWDDESENMLNASFSQEEENEDSELNNEPNAEEYPDVKGVIPKTDETSTEEEVAKANLMKDNRTRIINDLKRSLVSKPKDTSSHPTKLTTKDIIANAKSDAPDLSKSDLPASTSSMGVTKPNAPFKPITTKDIMEASKKAAVNAVTLTKPKGESVTVGKVVEPTITAPDENPDDVTLDKEVYSDEDLSALAGDTKPLYIDEDGEIDDDVMDAVDDAILGMQESNPDVLLNEDGKLTAREFITPVKEKIKLGFTPERTEEQKAKAAEYQAKQDEVIPKLPKAQEVKSKKIQVVNYGDAINTTNEALKESKFANFDKSYNEQKLQSDIDDAVKILSKASTKVFIVSKTEEDTSDQLNLKKTITYELRDEYGGKHIIKIDVPIVIDNNYVYINGAKILLGHQLMMMPIVKTGPADVQIVSWYNRKLTVRRMGARDTRTDSIKSYMERHNEKFEIVPGNAMNKNIDLAHPTTLDIDMYAKHFISFHIGKNKFVLDREALLDKLRSLWPNQGIYDDKDHIPVGYNTDGKKVIYVTPEESLTDLILKLLPNEAKTEIAKQTKDSIRKILRSEIKVMSAFIPLVLLLFFFEGFSTVMKKANILYHVVDKDLELGTIDRSKFDVIRCADKYILWERNPISNTLLMNGLSAIDMSIFDFEELEDRDTFANILSNYFGNKNIFGPLMQVYDFMIDPVTAEILEDFDLPTDLVSLLIVANNMLSDNSCTPINQAPTFRIRSNEIIAQMVYQQVVDAYRKFRRTEYKVTTKKKPERISVKQMGAIRDLLVTSSLSNDASSLNPILTIERARSVTPKGPSGVNKDRAMTLDKRAYDKSMLGILGVTTSPDAKVGITRQLTLEPNITSVRGYTKSINQSDPTELENLSNTNLLSPAELLSPPGVLHDDGPRTAMAYKQSQYMLPVDGSTPVFFGNKVEAVIPYHMTKDFAVVAKNDGVVVEIKAGVIIIQYKDGSYDSIDINPKMKKNSSGFFVKTNLTCTLTEVGQKCKKNDVIAYDAKAFTKNTDDRSASMNIGVPIKVAIMPNYDIYEDSGPITKKFSQKFTTHMSMKTSVGIPAQSYIEKMVDIGDHVNIDDPLIIYDPAHEDEGVNSFLDEIREKLGESLSDIVDLASMPQVRSHYEGIVSQIDVYSSVPVEELSPSLQEIFKKYTAQSNTVQKLLTKYQNPNDMKYFKCGQLITNSPEIVKPDYGNKVKGVRIGDDGRGLVIFFYVEFKDIAKAGDKGSAFTALKFTTSHVVAEGREPYSSFRPNEEVSTFLAPGSLLSRKTPSIWDTMATNKCIIEMKRLSVEMFFEEEIY